MGPAGAGASAGLVCLGAMDTSTPRPLRLGFPVKVMGRPGFKSNDTRRWQKNPHLKCSLEEVDKILDYLHAERLDMYRMSSDLAPYATHPDMPQFHNMLAESDAELRAFGAKARDYDIRLSFHPSQYVLLNSPNEELTRKSIWDLASQAEILDRMELDDEAVMITHVGGVYDDPEASRARWIDGWNKCPEHVRRRLVLENDDIRFSAADVLWIHERTGVRLIFDYQHFWCLNPERLDMRETLEKFLATWPAGVRPKIHFSSPRTEMRELKQKITATQRAKATGGKVRKGETLKAAVKANARVRTVLRPPIWTGHADFTNPFEFATFMRMAEGLEFDVMMEGKSKDVSLLKLRPDLLRFAPDVAARFGIHPEDAAALARDEAALEEGVAAEEEADVDEGAAELQAAE
jgi:UV DNA damage endonuclease